MNTDEIIAKLTEFNIQFENGGAAVVIEDTEGDLLEIEKVYFSPAGGGQVRIKALAYDDEFESEDVPDPDVEL